MSSNQGSVDFSQKENALISDKEECNSILSSTPRWLEIMITVLGLLGFIVFLTQYDRAFPAAALQLDLSREDIAERAQIIMSSEYGYDVSDYEFVLTFSGSSTYYLETELGIPATNRLIQEEDLPIWYWRARWFKPLQEEEFNLELAPNGKVVGFWHHIPEAETVPGLEEDQALELAEQYLVESLVWNLGDWELISSSSEERLGGRIDHDFQWKRRDFEAGESELRVSVGVQGDRIGNYDYWLKTPDAFWRTFREKADIAWFIDNWSTTIGETVFLLAAFITAFFFFMRGVQSWRRAILLALLFGGVKLLASLNYLPIYKVYYSTTEQYGLFWMETLGNMLLSSVYSTLYIFVVFMGALSLNKVVWPVKDAILPRGPFRWIPFARSSWRGLMLGGIHSAYVVGFYYLATQILGGWSPMDVSYSNLFATPFPFLSPIRSGLIPAINEELVYRLIGIAFLLWLTRHRWLAVLIPGAIWALAHLTYVRDPFYMRGVELLVVGLFYGLVFLKFDLVTVIMSHATYNALLGALPMLRSDEPYFVFSGAVVIAVFLTPVIPGLVQSLIQRRDLASFSEQPLIRLATKMDQDALSNLPVKGVDWTAHLIGQNSTVLALEHAGKIIGAAIGCINERGEGEVLQVYVHPTWRRQYWGSRIISTLNEELRKLGAQIINVDANVSDRTATAFWASQGWKPIRRTFSEASIPTIRQLVRQTWMAVRGKRT